MRESAQHRTECRRHRINSRAESAFYSTAQTFLSEFYGDVDLVPQVGGGR